MGQKGPHSKLQSDPEMTTGQSGVQADPMSAFLNTWAGGGYSACPRATVPKLLETVREVDSRYNLVERHCLFVEAPHLAQEFA